MKMFCTGGGPLDGQTIEATYDLLWWELDENGHKIKHAYRAVRHRAFADDPRDYYEYVGKEPPEVA